MARGTDGLLAFLELARLGEKWPQVRGQKGMLGCNPARKPVEGLVVFHPIFYRVFFTSKRWLFWISAINSNLTLNENRKKKQTGSTKKSVGEREGIMLVFRRW